MLGINMYVKLQINLFAWKNVTFTLFKTNATTMRLGWGNNSLVLLLT